VIVKDEDRTGCHTTIVRRLGTPHGWWQVTPPSITTWVPVMNDAFGVRPSIPAFDAQYAGM
jgi:hypothetical protein